MQSLSYAVELMESVWRVSSDVTFPPHAGISQFIPSKPVGQEHEWLKISLSKINRIRFLSQYVHYFCSNNIDIYVSLRLRVQNRRKKWNFPLNFRTMRKLSDLYSGIFQTQSSGCVSGLDHFRNFTNLKILNI